MRVTYYHRNSTPDFSVRRVFSGVRSAMDPEIVSHVVTSRFPSRGLWRRVYNTMEAVLRQGDVNHITGDVHYLTYFLRKKRTLLTILDLGTLHRLKGIRRSLFWFFWFWLPARRCSLITVISQATQNDLSHHLKIEPNRVRVVHCPVSEQFKPDHRPFNSECPTFLIIGTRPNHVKNIERMAAALKDVSCRARIVGELDESQKSAFAANTICYSTVTNISDDQVIEEYRACDALLFASTFEGFGLPIIEAQAIGRVVVTSNVYSMPEIAGEGACLVSPLDIDSIRAGVLRVIKDDQYRESLIGSGFHNVRRFSPTAIAMQYSKIYWELVAS